MATALLFVITCAIALLHGSVGYVSEPLPQLARGFTGWPPTTSKSVVRRSSQRPLALVSRHDVPSEDIFFPSDNGGPSSTVPLTVGLPTRRPTTPTPVHITTVNKLPSRLDQESNVDLNAEDGIVFNGPANNRFGGNSNPTSTQRNDWGWSRSTPPPRPVGGGEPFPTVPPDQEEIDEVNCERQCPVSTEFNQVCGLIGDQRVTFKNIGELKCASICSKEKVRLLFHSTCRQTINKLNIGVHFQKRRA